MKILSLEAEKGGLQKDPEISAQIELMRENALANAEMNLLEKGIALPEADVQKAYDEKKPTLEQAKVRHILVAFKGGQQPPAAGKKELTEDEAKAKAEEIRTKLIAGADFAETAKKESDDTSSAERGGEIGTLSRGRAPAEFDKAVFDGKVMEIGPIVKTTFGYHIIQVEERKTPTLADIRPQIEQELRQQKMQALVESIQSAAAVKFNDAYFAVAAAEPAPGAAKSGQPAVAPAASSIAPKSDDSKKIVVPPSGKQ
jgi:parvulin-like peptidyl-prolyl isomerase